MSKCENSGLVPNIVLESGCKYVKCSQQTESTCNFVPESIVVSIGNECSSQGLPVVRSIDNNGCAFYKCGETQTTCSREITPEAYKSCSSKGGEMIAKHDDQGCIVYAQCVARGDENQVHVEQVRQIPDATTLLTLAIKLEQLKIQLRQLADDSKEIAKYYASTSTGSLDEERYNKVSSMLESTASSIDAIKEKIKNNAENMTADNMLEIKRDVKYLKEVTLKDILYYMLSNSQDVKHTLETSKNITTNNLPVQVIQQSVRSCEADSSCFDTAIRSCSPVIFRPEGGKGLAITIVGLKDTNCVIHVQSYSDIPTGYATDNYYMDCSITNYVLGIKGPNDIIQYCQGPMADFMKKSSELTGG